MTTSQSRAPSAACEPVELARLGLALVRAGLLAGCSGGSSSGTAPTTPPQASSLSVNATGNGTVTSSLAAIDCGSACSAKFTSET